MACCRQVLGLGVELLMDELDAPGEPRRAHVQRRTVEQGATFSVVVPDPVVERASDLWEPVDELEREVPDIGHLHVSSDEAGGG